MCEQSPLRQTHKRANQIMKRRILDCTSFCISISRLLEYIGFLPLKALEYNILTVIFAAFYSDIVSKK